MPGAAGGGGPLDSPAHATSAAASTGVSLLPAVVASHEADGAGEMVGQRRQLGGAPREPFDRLALLRGRGRDGLRLLGGGLGARLRLPQRPADRARFISDAVGQLGDALASTGRAGRRRSEEHTSELQSLAYLVCRLLLEKKKKSKDHHAPTTNLTR